MTRLPLVPSQRASAKQPSIEITVDGAKVAVPEGATILDACNARGVSTPTLCFAENLTPVNVCRVCVVELEGARVLAPACSRRAEPGMVVHTDSPRVRLARKLVLELLGSSVDVSTAPAMAGFVARYGADPGRFGALAGGHGARVGELGEGDVVGVAGDGITAEDDAIIPRPRAGGRQAVERVVGDDPGQVEGLAQDHRTVGWQRHCRAGKAVGLARRGFAGAVDRIAVGCAPPLAGQQADRLAGQRASAGQPTLLGRQ